MIKQMRNNGRLMQAGSVGGGNLVEKEVIFWLYFYLIFLHILI